MGRMETGAWRERSWRASLALIALVVLIAIPAPAAGGAAWSIQPPPNPSAVSQLNRVSCANVRSCVAVGSTGFRPLGGSALAERWNGLAWQILPTPDLAGASASEFDDVSCTASRACTAVGTFSLSSGVPVAFAERWNGSTWTIQPIPTPAGAVGSSLAAVSCATATSCTAVGLYYRPAGRFSVPVVLAEHWNGATWEMRPTPELATGSLYVKSVSCARPRACTAVGQYQTSTGTVVPLAQRWNGSTWRIQAAPQASPIVSELAGVSCPTRRSCTAVGFAQTSTTFVTLVERWSARAGWRIDPSPSAPGGPNQLRGVSCPTPRVCSAVGEAPATPDGFPRLLAERRNRSGWRIEPTATPPGALFATSFGVSCPNLRCCALVGYWDVQTGRLRTLAEARSGRS